MYVYVYVYVYVNVYVYGPRLCGHGFFRRYQVQRGYEIGNEDS